MKRTLGLVAALILSGSLMAVPAGADAAQAKVLSKTQLRHALLTVDDLPEGFKNDPSAAMSEDSSDDGTTFTGDPACATWLDMADPVLNDRSAPHADRAFSRNHGTETLEAAVQSLSTTAQAHKTFADLNSLIGSCHHVTAHDPSDDTTIRFTIEQHQFRAHGHRAFVVTLRVHFQGLAVNMAIAAAQAANNVVEVDTTAFGKSATYETRLAKSLLRAQVAKLNQQLR